MSSVEAAASLFDGPEDIASDPFATLGVDSAEATTVENSHYTPDASDLFGSSSESMSFDGGQGSFQDHSSWSEPVAHQDTYGHTVSHSHTGNSSYGGEQSWNQYQTVSPAAQPTYTNGAHANQYNPYAPATRSSYTSPVPPVSHSQPAYDPYRPSAPAANTTYPSSPPVPAISNTSSYDPYKPAASVPKPPQSVSSYPYTGQTPYLANATVAPVVPPPPKPTVAPYRPKTLDAYDPPLPPPKPSKRFAVNPPRSLSPAVGQQTYPVYDSFTQSPPPVRVGSQYTSPPPPPPPQTSQRVVPPPPRPAVPNAYGYTGNNVSGLGLNGATEPSNWNSPNTHTVGDGYVSASDYHTDEQNHYAAVPPSQYASHTHITSPPSFVDAEPTEKTPRQLSDEWGQNPSGIYGNQSSQNTYQAVSPTGYVNPSQENDPSAVTSRDTQSEHHDSSLTNGIHSASFQPERVSTARSISPQQGFPPSRGASPKRTVSPGRATSPRRAVSPRGASPSPSRRGSVSGPARRNSGASITSQRAQSPYGPSPLGGAGRTLSPTPTNSLSQSAVNMYTGDHPTESTPGLNSYVPQGSNSHEPNSRPPPSRVFSTDSYDPSGEPPHDPYVPQSYAPTYQRRSTFASERVTSPASMLVRSKLGSQSVTSDPYAPSYQPNVPPPLELHNKSMSMSSNFSVSSVASDPYAPFNNNRQAGYIPDSNYASRQSHFTSGPYGPGPSIFRQDQELSLAAPTHAAYAPSPSLLGSNDPLGRTSARAPVFSFGFGGKFVTCFHGSSVLNTGFDVALSSRHTNDVQIHTLHKVIPASALDTSTAVYPGPLFADPGTPTTTNLVRSGASQTKTKKGRVTKYLDERAEELSQGLGYLNSGSADRRQAEGKLILTRLLKIMVENDGRLSGSSQIDVAVRAALVPRANDNESGTSLEASGSSLGYSTISSMTDLSSSYSESKEKPIAVTVLRPSALDKIREFLLRGKRREAYHYALDEKLWAHAMIIASSIDKDAWKEVVNDFLKSELGVNDDGDSGDNREGLRVVYSLFSGQGALAMQELLPPTVLTRPGANGLQIPAPPALSHVTPISPNFPPPSVTGNIPMESLSQWPEIVAMMISSPLTPESSSALTTLGDYLAANQWTEAAHACYLLSPQTSQVGGAGTPSVRVVLIGSRSPLLWPSFHKDPDSLIFSEIAEFALSLATTPKGQDAFGGLPHLQPYRLLRAMSLAELGHMQLAQRYCDAISSSLSRNSPYITPSFVEQLKGLTDRLTGAPHIDKSGSWIRGTMTKPSLDSIGNWLEGRLTKFIAGEGDSPMSATEESSQPEKPAYVGPFSHYSTISSATPSASPSPQPSVMNLNVLPDLPRRSGSAIELPSGSNTHVPIDRASSAMDYTRSYVRKASPGPRIASANPTTSTFSQSPSYGYSPSSGKAFNGYSPSMQSPPSEVTPTRAQDGSHDDGNYGQEVSWWGSSYSESSTAVTPTATTFMRTDGSSTSSDRFVSLMDDSTITVTPSSPLKNETKHSYPEEDDVEDLGFGNSKREKEMKENSPTSASTVAENDVKSEAPKQPEHQSNNSGSWISRWWRGGDSASPGPVKASLGEETSFYFDKDLKRWVNKKAGDDPAKPTAPAPPPRAQTASPGQANGHPPRSPMAGPGPPPLRPASTSVFDPNTVPPPTPKSISRIRSNLMPAERDSAPPSPAFPGDLSRPPSRPKSQASKRNIRSRYVDVLQTPGGA